MREHRDYGVELIISKRKRLRIGTDKAREPSDVLPSRIQLIPGDVGSRDGPAGTNEKRNRQTRSAPEIEAPTRSATEELHRGLPRVREHLGRRERLVPLGLAVVAGGRHPTLAVLEEAAPGLAPERAGLRHPNKTGRRSHPRLAERLPERFGGMDVHVDTDQVE